MRTALVTVIIPTHDHATTVDLAIESVLEQTVTDLDVVVIGDGATEATKAAVELFTGDRVRFLDSPKSASRAEEVRHEVLLEATSPFVCYLGDDDLMLADHVETMIGLLDRADFAHPLPVMVDGDGSLRAHPTDLSRPECILWHLDPCRNAISLTGASHRLDAYRRLPYGWRAAPPDRWSDHFMWEQWFRTPGFRFVTGDKLTVIKLEGSVRKDRTPEERRAELVDWKRRSRMAGFDQELARSACDAFRRWALLSRLELATFEERVEVTLSESNALVLRLEEAHHAIDEARNSAVKQSQGQQAIVAAQQTTIAELERDLVAVRARCNGLEGQFDAVQNELQRTAAILNATRATITWRLHDKLAQRPAVRRLARWTGRGQRGL